MTSGYERFADERDMLRLIAQLAARTVILDIEPLVAYWHGTQQDLDRGVGLMLTAVSAVPGVAVVCFATNSARRPTAVPRSESVAAKYLASAGKPLRTRPYRRFPAPGVVIGDQVVTDGVLARRLGYTFLHYRPQTGGTPAGPRLMNDVGRLARPLLFGRPGSGAATGRTES